ncbi:phospholipid/cholesterol/gamma-HCH transport system substrate-binding protein [Maribacter caenipelagi]|uniref:Phospholipid/cholesterol/gamma-HCH transport system substrate-binding protein n=1 Tax=Maribacter caenipelagi TaxID=1447781 RepID=A0A4R7D9E6_9FLAO|nr:MlaD family protein [Maribacter caenipelagi]TDS16881.1 phospholipid/cholesterol/gamma-HCH transport system substrate-binding protein [Maribacter caenipelagi]
MANTKLENLRLGIFVVLGTILLLIAAYLIGNRQNMFSKTFEITAVFKNATGLQNGNNVRFSGINVGTVNGIEMINDTTIQVRMVIQDNMRNHIKKNAIASIGTNGLVGSMLINIIPGEGISSKISPGDQLLSSNKIGTQDMMSTLSITNENAALLTADLLKISKTLTNGQGTLGRLLNDTIMANDLHKTIINLKNTSYKANATITNLNDIVGQFNFKESTADVLLNDTLSGRRIKNVIQNLETTSSEIDQMSKNLNLIIAEINDGQGAISYLAKDSLFVNQLERSMQNIEQGTERFNENMEALKHNFLTRGYFRKLEKQEKKLNKL